jgi:hypothetical protein
VILPGGLKVIQSSEMVEGPFEDWSRVRSPARARRRRRRGYRQNIRFYWVPRPDFLQMSNGTLVCHPAAYAELKARLASQGDRHE